MKLTTKTGKIYVFGSVTDCGVDGVCLEMKTVTADNKLVARKVVYPTWGKLLERLNTLEESEY